jgi:hypothetical protein
MADRYAKADELLMELTRYAAYSDAYEIAADMQPEDEGAWVRFEDVRDMLHASVDEALDRDR